MLQTTSKPRPSARFIRVQRNGLDPIGGGECLLHTVEVGEHQQVELGDDTFGSIVRPAAAKRSSSLPSRATTRVSQFGYCRDPSSRCRRRRPPGPRTANGTVLPGWRRTGAARSVSSSARSVWRAGPRRTSTILAGRWSAAIPTSHDRPPAVRQRPQTRPRRCWRTPPPRPCVLRRVSWRFSPAGRHGAARSRPCGPGSGRGSPAAPAGPPAAPRAPPPRLWPAARGTCSSARSARSTPPPRRAGS
jgi:hypothetical protein